MDSSQFFIGIDLGTTHCVVSYCTILNHTDSLNGAENSVTPTVKVFPIPQLVAQGQVQSLNQLPSFLYQAHESEIAIDHMTLPWSQPSQLQGNTKTLVGSIARNMGNKTPMRLIASAKSWLCHGGVDRRSAFLPQGSDDEVQKVSPLKATEFYLKHLMDAWDNVHQDAPLRDQQVTITIPASFDPAAKELTAEAARNTGFNHITLLEEPQAALYSWIDSNHDAWRDQVELGDLVLVVDIGGGTTDLSLVSVSEQEGNLSLERIAVGEHILLGGDNMDLALAYRLKMNLAQQGKQLQPWQVQAMAHLCRDAKEALLNDKTLTSVPIVVPSRGSKLLGSTLKTELTQQDVEQTLLEGFFPKVAVSEHPVQSARSALTQLGLPYAQDAGITRHIAAFLSRQNQDEQTEFVKPNKVLFNGGVLKSELISERLLGIINSWLATSHSTPITELTGVDLDLAVARGASYYGYVRHNLTTGNSGVRIRGGIASSYYVGIESAMPAIPGMAPPMEAICVAPFGLEEGSHVELSNQDFGLVIGQPVQFQFYGSTTRRDDEVGTHLDFWMPEELEELPEIHVTLDASNGRNIGDVVVVNLTATITEIGTLELEAIAKDNGQKWHVEFSVRQ
ncbi:MULTISPECIES: Hsp70 family protein [Vibrio]|uniref:Hsp70 family protein n=1 Tax=Vibrio casei TaxID=673372 RepID=A0A368LMM7_9VIBR|nr:MULTISPECIES: Hsp70 family protein [Vibrio]RCS73159.1 Hsp70 family protein [Vibrio casei]SJN41105.1 Sulfate permease [Vibrio casei]HBV75043.1 Hsp70 family protein [Vibrio sp.]